MALSFGFFLLKILPAKFSSDLSDVGCGRFKLLLGDSLLCFTSDPKIENGNSCDPKKIEKFVHDFYRKLREAINKL